MWNKELDKALRDIGYCNTKVDICCYIKKQSGTLRILLIWVNNITSIAQICNENLETKRKLKKRFEIKTIKTPLLILGMKVTCTDKQICLSQSHYINRIIDQIGLKNANPVSTPIDPYIDLDKSIISNNTLLETEHGSHAYAIAIRLLICLSCHIPWYNLCYIQISKVY